MNGLIYTLRLREPVLANSLAGDANSARSLLFVPGGLVRGALIGAYLRDKNISSGDTMNDEFRRLFLTNPSSDGKFERYKTRYLHAYPIADAVRTLPAPLAWKVRKSEAAGDERIPTDLCNFAVHDPNEEDDEQEKEKGSWEKAKFEAYWQTGQTVWSREVSIHFNLHTQRDAVYGRALEDRGAVFRYEALPPGLQVQGIILTETKDDADFLKRLLQENRDNLMLGKARTAGYGSVAVEEIEFLPSGWHEGWTWKQTKSYTTEDGDLREEEIEVTPPETVDKFIITFLSEGLVRDEHGQFTLDPLYALSKRLGIKVEVNLDAPPEKRCDSTPKIFRAVDIVGGFNRTWGLPLPQVPAIAAGSVFFLKTRPDVKWETLKQLEENGLGERKNEGFGRIKIDYYQPAVIEWTKSKTEDEKPEDEEIQLTGAAQRMANFMLRRLLGRELDRLILEFVRKYEVVSHTPIPNSQLSRWRVILRSALAKGTPAEKLSRLMKFAATERDRRSTAWQKMDRARLRTEQQPRLTDWIDDVLTGQHSPWLQLYSVKEKKPELKIGDSASLTVDEALTVEYKLRLIDAVLAERAKQNKVTRKQEA